MSKVAVVMLGNTVAIIDAIIRIASKVNSDVRRPEDSTNCPEDSTNCHQQKNNTDTVTVYNISTTIILTIFS